MAKVYLVSVLILALAIQHSYACVDLVFDFGGADSDGNVLYNYHECSMPHAYTTSFADAEAVCQRHGQFLPSYDQLVAAMGIGTCWPWAGWSGDGNAYALDCTSYASPLAVADPTQGEDVWCSTIDPMIPASWTEWSTWQACSETCGYGIQLKTRSCQGGDPGDEACEGAFYQIQTCYEGPCQPPVPTDEEVADRTAQLACDLMSDLFGGSTVYGFGKEIQVGNCNEVCSANVKVCGKALKVYPNPQRRLDKNLPQIFVYPNCATIYSNTCCCVNPPA